jgi:yecA family protein
VVSKRIAWEIDPRANAPTHSPPNPRAFEALPFTAVDRAALSASLAESGWPRWRMDISMLEGYLVALLAWPIDVAPGAWLPPIWGVAGWKVPAKINAAGPYREFECQVVGFLQHLDLAISTPDSGFVPALCLDGEDWQPRRPPGISWAQGFLRALQLCTQGLKGRSADVHQAIGCIALHASAPAATPAKPGAIAAELARAVNILAVERTSRGPLGPLPMTNRPKRPPRPVGAQPPYSGPSAVGMGEINEGTQWGRQVPAARVIEKWP